MPVPEANACAHLAANLGHGAIPDMEKEKEKQGQQGALGTSLEATVPFPADVCSGSDLSRARLAAIMFKEGQGSGEGAGHGFVAPAGLEAQKGACPRPSPTPPQASSPESGVTNSTMLSRLENTNDQMREWGPVVHLYAHTSTLANAHAYAWVMICQRMARSTEGCS